MNDNVDQGVELTQPSDAMNDAPAEVAGQPAGDQPAGDQPGGDQQNVQAGQDGQEDSELAHLRQLVDERTEDLQRLQAEYINYKKRVDRDRTLSRQLGVEAVLRDLLPVFDSILAAQAHDELTGGFKLTADEFTKVAKQYGLTRVGEAGQDFDPLIHEALMQVPVPGQGSARVHEVMQAGYQINGQTVRPARVVVALPDGDTEASQNGQQDGDGSTQQDGDSTTQ